MWMRFAAPVFIAALLLAPAASTRCQSLEWRGGGAHLLPFCLYGEIRVAVTGPSCYYCGAHWLANAPGEGYCGIEDMGGSSRRVVFSIWDSKQSPATVENLAEGGWSGRFQTIERPARTGIHTHFDCIWKPGQIFRYFLRQTRTGDRVAISYFFFNEIQKVWIRLATISESQGAAPTPDGTLESSTSIWDKRHGGPRLAFYKVWQGDSPARLRPLINCEGKGVWGTVRGDLFVGCGDSELLHRILKAHGGTSLRFGRNDGQPIRIQGQTLAPELVRTLERLR